MSDSSTRRRSRHDSVHIKLTPTLHRLVKSAAAWEGQTMADWVSTQLQNAVEAHQRVLAVVRGAAVEHDVETAKKDGGQ